VDDAVDAGAGPGVTQIGPEAATCDGSVDVASVTAFHTHEQSVAGPAAVTFLDAARRRGRSWASVLAGPHAAPSTFNLRARPVLVLR
jgi:hypothetical protein